MKIGRIVGGLFAGIALVNAIPHGVSAVQGRRFPSPFGTPPGQGLSSPESNAVWSIANAVLGWLLLPRGQQAVAERAAIATGAGVMVLFLATYFGRQTSNQ